MNYNGWNLHFFYTYCYYARIFAMCLIPFSWRELLFTFYLIYVRQCVELQYWNKTKKKNLVWWQCDDADVNWSCLVGIILAFTFYVKINGINNIDNNKWHNTLQTIQSNLFVRSFHAAFTQISYRAAPCRSFRLCAIMQTFSITLVRQPTKMWLDQCVPVCHFRVSIIPMACANT